MAEKTIPLADVVDILAAIVEALTLPTAILGYRGERLEDLDARVAATRGAIESALDGKPSLTYLAVTVRKQIENYPPTYPIFEARQAGEDGETRA